MSDANQMLRDDHRKVKELFRQFESATDSRQKRRIADEAISELEIHTKIEESIYYPAVRKQDDGSELVEEAEQEHEVVERLAKDLKRMRSVNEQYEAKFKVMAENVKHHIEEEEMQMLPMAAEQGMDRLRELGEKMEVEKLRLMKAGSRSRNGSRSGKTKRARTATGTRSRANATRSRPVASRSGTRTRATVVRSRTQAKRSTPRSGSRSLARARSNARTKPSTSRNGTRTSTTVRSPARAKPSTTRSALRSSARTTRRSPTRSPSPTRSR